MLGWSVVLLLSARSLALILGCAKQATAGLLADGRHLANRAVEEAENYREQYHSPAPVKVRSLILCSMHPTLLITFFAGKQVLADRIGHYCQAYTLYSSVRPFGLSAILGGVDKAFGPSLFLVEPSGVYWVRFSCFSYHHMYLSSLLTTSAMFQGYRGCAIGKGRQLAKTEIEKLKLEEMTAKEAIDEAARM